MTDNLTISLLQLAEKFPTEAAARQYLEGRRWPNGVRCPACTQGANVTTRKRSGYYRCNPCREDFTVRTGTVMERSHVPLHKWLYAMYFVVTSRKGHSSLQLSKEIGVTQKTAWFLLHRLREACGAELPKLRGTVEVDETYIGGREENKHERKKLKLGRGTIGKTPVLGLRERGGKTVAVPVRHVTAETLLGRIHAHVEVGSTIHSDAASAYDNAGGLFFRHETVNHSAKEYVRGNVTTNGIESVFAVLKRGLHGVYHHASPKHLRRYVGEFAWRLNEGNCQRHTLARLDSFVDATVGRRLTYRELTR